MRFAAAGLRWLVLPAWAILLLSSGVLAQSVQIENGERFDDLALALRAAEAGDVLIVDGTHYGSFTIERPLTLRAGQAAVLDGQGTATVLVIKAEDVRVEGLAITRSGISDDYWQSWGAAGVRVEGDRAVLAGLDVSGNGWGIVFRAGKGSLLRDSLVTDNQRDGVLVMGGEDHTITGNQVLRNRMGIRVDPLVGDSDRILMPLVHDPEWSRRVAELQASAIPALRHVITDNIVRGNANTGIWLQFHVRETRVERNRVFATGIEREPDAAERAFWDRELNIVHTPVETEGTGIGIFCWPEDNLVADNEIFDNRAIGIYLTIAERNRIEANKIHGNAIGIEISSAQDNEIVANRVGGNGDFGIRASGWLWMGQGRSDRNLIHLNDLFDNGVNAFDGSDRILSVEEIASHIMLMPWPEQMSIIRENAAMRMQMAQTMVGRQEPAHNRWDDDTHGNRHDDFDEAHEGFVDRDGDGVGEIGRSIQGGGGSIVSR